MASMKKVAAVVFAVAGVSLLVVALTRGGDATRPDPEAGCKPKGLVSVGESIPSECSFEKLGGGTLRLADLAGKPAVINFWASWCTYCIEEMPTLQKVYASLAGRAEFVGADLVGVDGETETAAQQFARSTGVQYPLIYDKDGLLYANFSARLVMPVTIFVRSDGIVAHRLFGPLNERNLREILSAKLGLN